MISLQSESPHKLARQTFIHITKEVKQDLRIWEMFFHCFNGKSFFLEEVWTTSAQLRFYTDAAKSKGYGIVFGSHWAYGEWPENWKNERDISFLEFFAILAGLRAPCTFRG